MTVIKASILDDTLADMKQAATRDGLNSLVVSGLRTIFTHKEIAASVQGSQLARILILQHAHEMERISWMDRSPQEVAAKLTPLYDQLSTAVTLACHCKNLDESNCAALGGAVDKLREVGDLLGTMNS